ncbi:MAG: hypothetical protein M1828_007439 [Chrysothrix sp. TS-e1954]|nr:MAG: hypothetical protein M1828_007439 [Chrysothrix sp. TS-e1954]
MPNLTKPQKTKGKEPKKTKTETDETGVRFDKDALKKSGSESPKQKEAHPKKPPTEMYCRTDGCPRKGNKQPFTTEDQEKSRVDCIHCRLEMCVDVVVNGVQKRRRVIEFNKTMRAPPVTYDPSLVKYGKGGISHE